MQEIDGQIWGIEVFPVLPLSQSYSIQFSFSISQCPELKISQWISTQSVQLRDQASVIPDFSRIANDPPHFSLSVISQGKSYGYSDGDVRCTILGSRNPKESFILAWKNEKWSRFHLLVLKSEKWPTFDPFALRKMKVTNNWSVCS
jgi:hypothetical protein